MQKLELLVKKKLELLAKKKLELLTKAFAAKKKGRNIPHNQKSTTLR
jgi:hypothetical protein